MLSRTRAYALVLVSGDGRILYADKLGHELLEGSLNNFDSCLLQNLMLGTQRNSYLESTAAIREYN